MNTTTLSTYALAIAIALAAVLFLIKPFDHTGAAGWDGFPSHIQSATSTSVGIYAPVTLFADEESPMCHSRVVTTNHDIRISFDEVAGHGSSTLSTTVGHFQAASTTVAYDSGLYGCGQMTARAITATTTVTKSSF